MDTQSHLKQASEQMKAIHKSMRENDIKSIDIIADQMIYDAKLIANAAKDDIKDGVNAAKENIDKTISEASKNINETFDSLQKQASEKIEKISQPFKDASEKIGNSKNTIDEIKKEQKKLRTELSQALRKGMNEQDKDTIDELSNKIAENAAKIQAQKNDISNVRKELVTAPIGKLKECYDKVEGMMDQKLKSSKATISSMKTTVEKANKKALEVGKSAYNGVAEKCASLHRGWLEINSKINDKIIDTLQEHRDKLNESMDRKNEGLGMIKAGIGKLLGREVEINDSKTDRQTEHLKKLDKFIGFMKKDSIELQHQYDQSIDKSADRISKDPNLQKSMKVPETKTLSSNVKEAQENIKTPKTPKEPKTQAQTKPVPNQDAR